MRTGHILDVDEYGFENKWFSDALELWYNAHKRDLPWRKTKDPYFIWLSEIILQQTRVAQGRDYFLRFAKQYPNVRSLALASEEDVLKLWQGLGYYSRARNLLVTARIIKDEYGGVFPGDYMSLLALKGVGEYTAAAIASFSFNLPYAVVDGNVYRVLARVFGLDAAIDTTIGKKSFSELASHLLDRLNAGLYNQAIMEFGALQCVPVSPNCSICPFVDRCVAYIDNKVRYYPVKHGRIKTRNRYFNYLEICWAGRIYIQKRTKADVWQNMYELPLIESDEKLTMAEMLGCESFISLFGEMRIEIELVAEMKHVLSHQVIYASFYRVFVVEEPKGVGWLVVDKADLVRYPVSRLIHKYIEGFIV